MKKIAFVYPGQGSQKIGMGKTFFDNFNEAKETFQEIDETLKQNLSSLIFEGAPEELNQTENTQPALMAVSLAISKTIDKQSGKKTSEIASFACGHSLGEYSALASVNSLNVSDAAKILKVRGQAMSEAGKKQKGAMAAIIGVDFATAKSIAEKSAQGQICQIANDNSEGQIVLSGNEEAIDRSLVIGKEMGAKKIVKLPVSGAFHSPLIESAAEKLSEGLKQISIEAPEIPIISNVTASAEQDSATISNLLVKQITSTVRWRESVLELKNLGITDIVEIGSGKVLTGLIKRITPEINCSNIIEAADLDEFIKNYI